LKKNSTRETVIMGWYFLYKCLYFVIKEIG